MKSKFSDRERLLHILDAINSIENFTQEVSYDEYMNDLKLRLALVKLESTPVSSPTMANDETDEHSSRFLTVKKSCKELKIGRERINNY